MIAMNKEAACADGCSADGEFPSSPEADVASPCTGVCQLHPDTGWCQGCFRRIDEIAGWGQLDVAARREILARLPARRLAAPPSPKEGA